MRGARGVPELHVWPRGVATHRGARVVVVHPDLELQREESLGHRALRLPRKLGNRVGGEQGARGHFQRRLALEQARERDAGALRFEVEQRLLDGAPCGGSLREDLERRPLELSVALGQRLGSELGKRRSVPPADALSVVGKDEKALAQLMNAARRAHRSSEPQPVGAHFDAPPDGARRHHCHNPAASSSE